ncbi:V-set and transmembrane domain-containing protein 5 [Oncorhynchus clarkii lewisi]|uniref:V-set and transmembrane domain-containing protein 5 n=1 Tax=Oncorhynchus clarkii lewisi TaxID=490388 RepID=UPI0039B852F5
MWLWDTQEVALFFSITLYVCHLAGAILIRSPQQSLTRPVQQDVLFSVDISCVGIPTVQWTFMSGRVSRDIGAWQPGGFTNVSEDYMDRILTYTNGSMGLSDLRIQDTGFYVITVTELSGSSKDAGFVLNVEEVLYEDLQYLAVFAVVLASLAGFLMVSMWLMDKAYSQINAWRQRRQMPENDVTELQPL